MSRPLKISTLKSCMYQAFSAKIEQTNTIKLLKIINSSWTSLTTKENRMYLSLASTKLLSKTHFKTIAVMEILLRRDKMREPKDSKWRWITSTASTIRLATYSAWLKKIDLKLQTKWMITYTKQVQRQEQTLKEQVCHQKTNIWPMIVTRISLIKDWRHTQHMIEKKRSLDFPQNTSKKNTMSSTTRNRDSILMKKNLREH